MILLKHIRLKASANLDVFAPGRFSMNPSIVKAENGYICAIAGINWDRQAIYYSGDWRATEMTRPISYKYKLLQLDIEFNVISAVDLATGEAVDVAPPYTVDIQDLRLFYLGPTLMAMGTFNQRKGIQTGRRWIITDQTNRVFLARVDSHRLTNLTVFESPVGAKSEKNWIPCPRSAASLSLICNINTGARMDLEYNDGWRIAMVGEKPAFAWNSGWSGSSCLVPYRDGYMAIVHSSAKGLPELYRHMFIITDAEKRIIRRSEPFSFDGMPIEFCCGLAIDEPRDSAVISIGRFDRTAHLLEFALTDISRLASIEVDDRESIGGVRFACDGRDADAAKCLAGYEGTIWTLGVELVEAQLLIDRLRAESRQAANRPAAAAED